MLIIIFDSCLNIRMKGEDKGLEFHLGQNVDVRDTTKKWVNG